MSARDSSIWTKKAEHEAHHSPQSGVEIKNVRSHTSNSQFIPVVFGQNIITPK
jgi:hypothetical protein